MRVATTQATRALIAASSTTTPRPGVSGSTNSPSFGRGIERKSGVHAAGRIGVLRRLGHVHERRQHMQIGDVADRRLRLVRHELDAVRVADRGALHQAGDAAHLDDVGLHHAHAGVDHVDQRLQRVGLLGRRDRDVEPLRDLAHAAHVVVLHRLLEPLVAELLERAPDAHGAADGVAVVGVEAEAEVVADELAHRLRLGDVAGNVEVELRAVAVTADLDRRRLFRFETRAHDLQHLLDAARAHCRRSRRRTGSAVRQAPPSSL